MDERERCELVGAVMSRVNQIRHLPARCVTPFANRETQRARVFY